MLGQKFLLAFSALGLALATTTTCAHTTLAKDSTLNITVPMFRPAWGFDLAVLALKPGASNLNYVIYNQGLPLQSPSWYEKELRPGYAPAFALGAHYNFSEGKDVSLNWTHLNTSTTASVGADTTSYFLGPDYEIGPTGIPIRNASGKVRFQYDVVNLDAGQWAAFGNSLQMRFFGGLSNAYLREQTIATYSGNTTGTYAGPFTTMQEVTANFIGLGPRLGCGANYSLGHGWGLLGEGAASLLIGSSYSKTFYVSSAKQLLVVYGQTSNSQFIKDQNVTQVIPGLDAKLGLNYSHALRNNMLVTVKAGYQAAVYINAINQYLPGTLVSGSPLESGGIFVATMNHTQSNYSVQGPFLEATLEL